MTNRTPRTPSDEFHPKPSLPASLVTSATSGASGSSSRPTTPPPPTVYDPSAPSEAPVPLPNAPRKQLALTNCELQPPLSRRGTGPGLIVVLPRRLSLHPHAATGHRTPLDPEPVEKWAEEGFAVVGVRLGADTDVVAALSVAIEALEECPAVDIGGKYAVLVYDPSALEAVVASMSSQPSIVALISHGSAPSTSSVPAIAHVSAHHADRDNDPPGINVYAYGAESPYFIVPSSGHKAYSAAEASLAHSRSLTFLREQLGGPHFDLEAIWEEHTYFEFGERSVAKTMGTMVAEPYVNHVPTMTGGVGRVALERFYRDHFIFSNPADADLVTISRTVGADRVVDEFIYSCTHDCMIDWLLPGVPPTGKKIELPMVAVVNIRGDRVYDEHIWWDQASALQQVGFLPETVPCGAGVLRLPVAGYQSANMLVNENDGESNAMMGKDWGVQPAGAAPSASNQATECISP